MPHPSPKTPLSPRTPRSRALEIGTMAESFVGAVEPDPSSGLLPGTPGESPGRYEDVANVAVRGGIGKPSEGETPFKIGS